MKDFKYEWIHLNDSKYFETPLLDSKKGFKTYPGLKELQFFIYIFEWNKDKINVKENV